MEKSETPKMKPFLFDKRLVEIPDFKNAVHRGWNKEKAKHGHSIMDQVRNCRQAMARLKHQFNLNSEKRIKHLQAALNNAMSSLIRSERMLIP